MNLYSPRLFVIVLIIYYEIGVARCEFDYCDNLPACLNKPHILCKETQEINPRLHNATISAILDPLNEYRTSIRSKMSVCNLPNLKWNVDLELLAWKAVSNGFDHFCYITTDYKNILYFELILVSAGSITNNEILFEFTQLTSSINQKDSTKFWLSSAYSREIGCVRSYGTQITCLITGTKLKYFNQSFGYDVECYRTSTLNNKICRHQNGEYNCTDHFICESYDSFKNIQLLSLDFTTRKFILTKLENEQKFVEWDSNLEYLAGRLVTQKLTSSDKCFAQALFRNMGVHHFRGVQYFSEYMSSIDSAWAPNGIQKKVGCAAYHTKINVKTIYNLYCLYDQPMITVRINIVNHFIAYINNNELYHWLTILIMILLVVCTGWCMCLCFLQAYTVCILKSIRTTKSIDLDEPVYEMVNNFYN